MLDKEYQVVYKKEQSSCIYPSCCVEEISLKRHKELPHNFQYSSPQITSDDSYIGLLGKNEKEDILIIWSSTNMYKYCYIIKQDDKHIDTYEFAPNAKTFLVVYKDEPPINYNFSTGTASKALADCKKSTNERVLGTAFSPKGRYFCLVTDCRFVIWDVLKGNILKNILENSPSKFVRGKYVILLTDQNEFRFLDYQNEQIIHTFKINNIKKYTDVLALMLNETGDSMYYGIKEGIFMWNIQTKEVICLKAWNDQENLQKIIISSDCCEYATTNWSEIKIYSNLDFQNENCIVLKEEFSHIEINFLKGRWCTLSEICFNITNYRATEQQFREMYIWLNKNPVNFVSFSLSPDKSSLLAIVDEHNAVWYNCKTGNVLKKWRNKLENWALSCIIVPTTNPNPLMVTKSTDTISKVWDYKTGNEMFSLSDYNAYTFCFHPTKHYLAGGGNSGPEIARVWDFENKTSKSFYYDKGSNYNKHTSVEITQDSQNKLIVASEKQEVLVFSFETGEWLYNIPTLKFSGIDKIQSSKNGKVFIILGIKNETNITTAGLYDWDKGQLVRVYNNCFTISISPDSRSIISKCGNENLIVSDITNICSNQTIVCEVKANIANYLEDGKAIVCPLFGNNEIKYYFFDASTGKALSELVYYKKGKYYSLTHVGDLTKNYQDQNFQKEQNLIFRYIQLK